jgi:hypothetical protein
MIRPKIYPNIKIKIHKLGVKVLTPVERHMAYDLDYREDDGNESDHPEEQGMTVLEKLELRNVRLRKRALENDPELRRRENIFTQRIGAFEAFVNKCTEETLLMFRGRLFWIEANDNVSLPFRSICTLAPFLHILILKDITVKYSDLQLLVEYKIPLSVIGKITLLDCNVSEF